jgi:hypothetical protein
MQRKDQIIISYIGGGGGNWLNKAILSKPLDFYKANFHDMTQTAVVEPNAPVICRHEIDPAKFDYLLTGSCYFNFYLNLLAKTFYFDNCRLLADGRKRGDIIDWKTFFLRCVGVSKYVCEYDVIKLHIFFDFADLINQPQVFFEKFCYIQNLQSLPTTTRADFEQQRIKFINTCPNGNSIYQNWQNPVWPAFILGQLAAKNIHPVKPITGPGDFDYIVQFAKKNWEHVTLLDTIDIGTSLELPNEFIAKWV